VGAKNAADADVATLLACCAAVWEEVLGRSEGSESPSVSEKAAAGPGGSEREDEAVLAADEVKCAS
jgi:hypothetical protein